MSSTHTKLEKKKMQVLNPFLCMLKVNNILDNAAYSIIRKQEKQAKSLKPCIINMYKMQDKKELKQTTKIQIVRGGGWDSTRH